MAARTAEERIALIDAKIAKKKEEIKVLEAQKQKLLSSAVSETKEKLATLKTAAEQANQALAKRRW